VNPLDKNVHYESVQEGVQFTRPLISLGFNLVAKTIENVEDLNDVVRIRRADKH
jgi:hypothetical protein